MFKVMIGLTAAGFAMYLTGWYIVMDASAKVAVEQAAYYDSLIALIGK